jgi:hypothetical protein
MERETLPNLEDSDELVTDDKRFSRGRDAFARLWLHLAHGRFVRRYLRPGGGRFDRRFLGTGRERIATSGLCGPGRLPDMIDNVTKIVGLLEEAGVGGHFAQTFSQPS